MIEELVIVDMGKGPSMNESLHSHRFTSYGYWANNRMAHHRSSVNNFGCPPHELRVSPDIADLKAHERPICTRSTSSYGALHTTDC